VTLLSLAGFELGSRAQAGVVYQDEMSGLFANGNGLDWSLTREASGAADAPELPDNPNLPLYLLKNDLLAPSGAASEPDSGGGSNSQVQHPSQPVAGLPLQPIPSSVLPHTWEDEHVPDPFLESVFRPPRSPR